MNNNKKDSQESTQNPSKNFQRPGQSGADKPSQKAGGGGTTQQSGDNPDEISRQPDVDELHNTEGRP